MKTPNDIVKTTFKLDRTTWRALRMVADEEGRDMNDVALAALRAYVRPRWRELLNKMQKLEIGFEDRARTTAADLRCPHPYHKNSEKGVDDEAARARVRLPFPTDVPGQKDGRDKNRQDLVDKFSLPRRAASRVAPHETALSPCRF